jgi:hypothetical protein
VDLGGGRVISVDGGGSAFFPGTAVKLLKSEGASVREAAGLASKRFQPTNPTSATSYDPTGLKLR